MGAQTRHGQTTPTGRKVMTPEEQAAADKAAAEKKAAQSQEDEAKTLADIKAAAEELGITPGQLKGRLEASRTWEQRAKQVTPEELAELRKAAAELKTIQDANKSENEKLLERIAAAEKAASETTEKLTASEQRALRSEVALAKGVPAELLTGTTQEELEASATTLLAFKGTPVKPDMGGGTRGGDIGDGKKQLTSVEGMTTEEIVQAKAAGLLNDLLAGKK
jgi:hypothetical protein